MPIRLSRSLFAALLYGAAVTPAAAQWICVPNAGGSGWACGKGRAPAVKPATGGPATATPAPAVSIPVAPAPGVEAAPVPLPATGGEAPKAPPPAATAAPASPSPTASSTPAAAAAAPAPAAAREPAATPLSESAPVPELRPLHLRRFATCPPMLDVLPRATVAGEEPATDVDAAVVHTADGGKLISLDGAVHLRRGDQYLQADEARYDGRRDTFDAKGKVLLRQPGLAVEAEKAHLELATGHVRFDQARYRLPRAHAHGEAASLVDEGDKTYITGFSYSTCSNESWRLKASRALLDRGEGSGSARNVRLELGQVPVFYLPYISFPIDKRRKSGFLAPSFKSNNTNGIDVATPYYWNQAPNADMTVTPRWVSRRGDLLGVEQRYLTHSGRGELRFEYLPQDDIYGDSRGFVSFQHQSALGRNWNLDVNLNHVSDSHYFGDLGDSLSVSSQSYMERRIDLSYSGDHLRLLGRVQGFQNLNGDEPYQRLPQLLVDADAPTPQWLKLGVRGEAVNFERDLPGPTGGRLDLWPRLGLDLEHAGWFLRPTASVRQTRYWIDNTSGKTTLQRTTPVVSLDSGLYLEREGDGYLQTLEPRLYYLYVPYRAQGDLPVFDTGLPTMTFTRLFSENRFSGADRMGDANQLAYMLRTQLLDRDSGDQRFDAAVGQVVYFRDRRVTLPGYSVDNRNSSDLLAELGFRPLRSLRLSSNLVWNPDAAHTTNGGVALHYQPAEDRIINLGYRYYRGAFEQSDISFLWPLARQWHAVGRWNYSFDGARTLEGLAGVEYDSCCWAIRLAARRFTRDLNTAYSDSIMLQVELKGLGSVGSGIESLLEDGILGYSRDYSRYPEAE